MSTWERPAHLALALAGYLRQTGGVDFELIVADDGSGPETAAVVRRFAEQAPFPVQHVWHAREGHHRTAILNLAVARASGSRCSTPTATACRRRTWSRCTAASSSRATC